MAVERRAIIKARRGGLVCWRVADGSGEGGDGVAAVTTERRRKARERRMGQMRLWDGMEKRGCRKGKAGRRGGKAELERFLNSNQKAPKLLKT